MTVAYDDEGRPLSLIDIRPMDLADILDSTIRIYRANPWTFIALLAAFISIPTLINQIADAYIEPAMRDMLMMQMQGGSLEDALAIAKSSRVTNSVIAIAATGPLLFFLIPLAQASIVHAVSETLLGRHAAFADSIRAIWPKAGSIILAYLLYTFVILIFFVPFLLFLGIPYDHPEIALIVIGFFVVFLVCFFFMFFFWIKFLFIPHAVVLDGEGALGSLKRSYTLTSGYWWRTFGIYFVVMLVVSIVIYLLSLLGILIDKGLTTVPGITLDFGIVVKSMVTTMVSLIINPITLIAQVLLYYDLRIRKEGFDLLLLASSLGGEKDGEVGEINSSL